MSIFNMKLDILHQIIPVGLIRICAFMPFNHHLIFLLHAKVALTFFFTEEKGLK